MQKYLNLTLVGNVFLFDSMQKYSSINDYETSSF